MFGLQDKDKPRGYDFVHSCYRHDFGYANFQQQKRFTPPNRKRIDDMFLNDLFAGSNPFLGPLLLLLMVGALLTRSC